MSEEIDAFVAKWTKLFARGCCLRAVNQLYFDLASIQFSWRERI